MLFMLFEVKATDADLLETQLAAPGLDRQGKFGEVVAGQVFGSGGHAKGENEAKVRIILPDIGVQTRMQDTQSRLPDALYTAEQVRDLDARLIAAGTPGLELMQRAARATWRAVRRRWPEAGVLTVLAGHGNNAGDGYLIAQLAHQAGWVVRVLAVGDPAALQDAAMAHQQARAAGVEILQWLAQPLAGVVVDALLGTGLRGDVREPYKAAIDAINAADLPVVAVDIPSGLSADTGRVLGCAVCAELTVTFIGLKLGLFTAAAADHVGHLLFDDLQADPRLVSQTLVTATRLHSGNLPVLAPRPRTAHKGQYGRVLVVGGDHGFGGAALLSAESALRSGAGMLTLATRPEHVTAALVRMPEVMSAGIHSANQMTGLVAGADVLVAGPGLGQEQLGAQPDVGGCQCRPAAGLGC